MNDFIRGDCHKCKYETSAECVPRSQKMGWPKCYQSIVTNADRIRAMTDEELAKLFNSWLLDCDCNDIPCRKSCEENSGSGCINHWLDWLKQEASDGEIS